MKYKNNVLDKITQLEATIARIQLQINRNMSQDEILNSIELLKENTNNIRDIISLEHDNFEQQFNRS